MKEQFIRCVAADFPRQSVSNIASRMIADRIFSKPFDRDDRMQTSGKNNSHFHRVSVESNKDSEVISESLSLYPQYFTAYAQPFTARFRVKLRFHIPAM